MEGCEDRETLSLAFFFLLAFLLLFRLILVTNSTLQIPIEPLEKVRKMGPEVQADFAAMMLEIVEGGRTVLDMNGGKGRKLGDQGEKRKERRLGKKEDLHREEVDSPDDEEGEETMVQLCSLINQGRQRVTDLLLEVEERVVEERKTESKQSLTLKRLFLQLLQAVEPLLFAAASAAAVFMVQRRLRNSLLSLIDSFLSHQHFSQAVAPAAKLWRSMMGQSAKVRVASRAAAFARLILVLLSLSILHLLSFFSDSLLPLLSSSSLLFPGLLFFFCLDFQPTLLPSSPLPSILLLRS